MSPLTNSNRSRLLFTVTNFEVVYMKIPQIAGSDRVKKVLTRQQAAYTIRCLETLA